MRLRAPPRSRRSMVSGCILLTILCALSHAPINSKDFQKQVGLQLMSRNNLSILSIVHSLPKLSREHASFESFAGSVVKSPKRLSTSVLGNLDSKTAQIGQGL